MEKGVPIRAISRCISVLQAINRRGSLSMMEIAQTSGVPYPTACRIVQTLLHEKLIEREPARKRYRPTMLVQSLSHGFQESDRLVACARPHIVDLTAKVTWPVSIATRVGQQMMIRDSTHTMTSLTLNNYYPGYTLPILESAAGKAYLAFASPEEQAAVLEAYRSGEGQVDPLTLQYAESGGMFADIVEAGVATKGRNPYTATPGKTSSIGAPIFNSEGVCGALVLVFFSSSMKMPDAVKQYGDKLKIAAAAISRDLSEPLSRAA
ncbi:IclR family transcriptional regulator [Caulobacter flavus]|uniref:IclR family transcriptional regulator n=2 Tax=Caulobacter TaxID=75 RepID=A0A2N5CPE4_9CAUL|nr:helix-turn-helix domain-containing protein [Caulobacter flavus]AYV48463.1 IclR family transcriptional regulator [Caulobacter flavus]PLR08821.1 IclR family transcriptional regulator [Caulobacter flavus]PLR28741.1 IclR family transcriptional regulator [Caulobacter zeae]